MYSVPRPAHSAAAGFFRLDAALRNLQRYAWVCFTSTNGVAAFVQRARASGWMAAHWQAKIAAIGPATAAALGGEFPPDRPPARKLYRQMPGRGDARPRGRSSGPAHLLARRISAGMSCRWAFLEAGAMVEDVAVYQTVRPQGLPEDVLERLVTGRVDWITFTSSSTVENFLALLVACRASNSIGGCRGAGQGQDRQHRPDHFGHAAARPVSRRPSRHNPTRCKAWWNRCSRGQGFGGERMLEITFLGTGTSHGIPMIGCHCPVCRSDDPRDKRNRTSVSLTLTIKRTPRNRARRP